jgi:protein-disulfide isomerase
VGVKADRRTVLMVLAGAVALAAVLAVVLVVVSRGSGGGTTTTFTTPTASLAGLAQHGNSLGNPKAPALVEFADLQCPFCAEWSRDVFPAVVRDYIRNGKVRLVFHGLAFIGPDSQKALQAVFAAGNQNKLFDVLEALYANQGGENKGWVTDGLLKQVGKTVPGLDVSRWLKDANGSGVQAQIAAAAQAATDAGVQSTPTFVFKGQQLQLTALDPTAFHQALDPLLGG